MWLLEQRQADELLKIIEATTAHGRHVIAETSSGYQAGYEDAHDNWRDAMFKMVKGRVGGWAIVEVEVGHISVRPSGYVHSLAYDLSQNLGEFIKGCPHAAEADDVPSACAEVLLDIKDFLREKGWEGSIRFSEAVLISCHTIRVVLHVERNQLEAAATLIMRCPQVCMEHTEDDNG